MNSRHLLAPVCALFVAVALFVSLTSTSHAARPSGGGGGGRGPLQLTGANVAPEPGEPGGLVLGEIAFSRNELCFEFAVQSLGGRITHIGVYRGAAGFTGPEVVVLNPMPPGVMGLRGCVPVDRELARVISRDKAGYYVMIVTDTHPGGAVRAQLGR